jgi:hypothetical protein
MIIVIETTRNLRRFKLSINRVYQGVFGLQRILERVAVSLAGRQSGGDDMILSHRTAMDALDFAAAAIERLLKQEAVRERLAEVNDDPQLDEADYQALLDEVRANPELRHAWEHASEAFGMARGCESRQSTLGHIAAGLASAYALLGDDLAGEQLRELYEEAEPLVTLLLNLHQRFGASGAGPVRISSPGGDA